MTFTKHRAARRAIRGIMACMLGIMILAASAPLPADGGQEPLPEAGTLFDRFVETTGGTAAYDRLQNRLTRSSMRMSFPAMTGSVTSQLTRSGPYHVVVDSSMGRIEYGSDGQTVWEINPLSGPRAREGKERLRFLSLYGMDLPARWRQVFRQTTCSGRETIAGKPAFRVVALTRDDFQLTYYFDSVSGLLVKIELPEETAAGPAVQEILLGDYRPVDGIRFPYSQVRRETGREMTITYESVAHNVDIPADRFALPETIRRISASGK